MNEQSRRTSIAATIGFLLGVGVMALLATHVGLWRRHRLNPDRMLQKFTREYDLTPDQQNAARLVLEDNAKKLDALHQETQAKLAEVRVTARAQLRAVLDPEQQTQFDAKVAQSDARHKHDLK